MELNCGRLMGVLCFMEVKVSTHPHPQGSVYMLSRRLAGAGSWQDNLNYLRVFLLWTMNGSVLCMESMRYEGGSLGALEKLTIKKGMEKKYPVPLPSFHIHM